MSSRYPFPTILTHWLTTLAVMLAYSTGGDPSHGGSFMDVLMGQLQVSMGGLVMILAILRFLPTLSLKTTTPEPVPRWQPRSAVIVQSPLYALIAVRTLSWMGGISRRNG